VPDLNLGMLKGYGDVKGLQDKISETFTLVSLGKRSGNFPDCFNHSHVPPALFFFAYRTRHWAIQACMIHYHKPFSVQCSNEVD